jgi:hypothetical protein
MKLTKYEEARAALALCVRVDEVKTWQDKAAGMAAYAKQANDPELLVYAQKIRLQAQRRAGEILIKTAETGERFGRSHPRSSPTGRSTLEKLGITYKQSMQWQRIAKLATKDFDAMLADIEARLRGKPVKRKAPPRTKAARRVGTVLDKGAAERWHNAILHYALDTSSMRQGFAESFGADWTQFPVTQDLVAAADRAVQEWQELAAFLKGRLQ